MADSVSILCNLTDAAFRERESLLLARFREAVAETTELPDGFAFHAPGDKTWIALLAELMVAERECCPFLRFELAAEPNMGRVTLSVTGPPGAKAFLKKLLCEPGDSRKIRVSGSQKQSKTLFLEGRAAAFQGHHLRGGFP